ncbi:Hypothetical protein PHPALM_17756, partial [Phytophthora palmivora]
MAKGGKSAFVVDTTDISLAERPGSFDESVGYSDAKEDDEEEYLEEKAAMPDLSEAAVVSVGRSGEGDDGSDGLKPSAMTGKATSRSTGNRPPVNGDTPAANKVLGRCLEFMKTRSNWMQLFGPKLVRQTVWMDLGGELAVPIDSTSTRQVVQDTVLLLRAMGPDDLSDSDNDSGDFDYIDGDLTEEWERQIRELSKAETKSSTPRLELATHLPLGNIKPYFGLRNKSEKSMQCLRTFIYAMKGTHTPPNEWCMAFEPSLQDGALHWYRQLPRKTRRIIQRNERIKSTNRLNGYARTAGVQFENGGRDAKDHVEHFLDTCDDRGLEERLCHVRVKDIYDLEDMVNDILR